MDLSLAGPVLYAGIAFGVSVSAVIFGYLYTKGRGTAVDTKVGEPTKSDVKNTKNSEVKSTSKPTSNVKPSYGIGENKSPVSTGAWPLEDKPEVLPMPDNMPENLKKILDMGFPGCPVFRRKEDIARDNEAAKKTMPTNIPEDKPEILPMPENISEDMKKILDMGFPGCPVFRRKEDIEQMEKNEAEKAAAPIGIYEDKPEILPMPDNMPENLKKILDMGFPGCPVFKRREDMASPPGSNDTSGTKPSVASRVEDVSSESDRGAAGGEAPEIIIPQDMPEDLKRVLELTAPGTQFKRSDNEAMTLDDKTIMYVQAMRDALGTEAVKDITILSQMLKSSGVMERKKGPATDRSCPRGTHCRDHCSCLFKISMRGETADGEGDAAKTDQERDPVEYCSHLQSEVKKTKQKVAIDKIEEKMSADQKEEERRIQSEQLSAIFNLMSNQQEKFGVDTMDEMQSQMKLYM